MGKDSIAGRQGNPCPPQKTKMRFHGHLKVTGEINEFRFRSALIGDTFQIAGAGLIAAKTEPVPVQGRISQKAEQRGLMIAAKKGNPVIGNFLREMNKTFQHLAGMISPVNIIPEKDQPYPAAIIKSGGIAENLLDKAFGEIMTAVNIADRVNPLIPGYSRTRR